MIKIRKHKKRRIIFVLLADEYSHVLVGQLVKPHPAIRFKRIKWRGEQYVTGGNENTKFVTLTIFQFVLW